MLRPLQPANRWRCPRVPLETYTIDPWGNMQQSGNFNFTQSFSTNNQISGTGYSYDAAGNLLTDGNGNTYTYNTEGKLATNNGLQYIYDALGQWVSEGSSGSSEMIYFGGRQIAFHLPNGSYLADLIWAGNTMVAMVPGSQTASPVYRIVDNVGTLAMFTDGSGNPGGANLLSPFGQWITHSAGDLFPFAGLLGLTNNNFHAQNRDYDPVAARWLTPDAYYGSYDLANPQSFNRYMYVNGNPLAFTDPSGQDFSIFVSALCGGYSGACAGGDLNPVTAILSAGLLVADVLNDIFGFWGQPPQFIGNVQASQHGKNVPQALQATKSLLDCAARFGNKYSIAGGLHAIGIGTSQAGAFLTNALAGNTVSGISNLITGGGSLTDVAFGGTRLGVPGAQNPLEDGIAGVVQTTAAGGIHSVISAGGGLTTLEGTTSTVALTASEYAAGFGELKFTVDAAIYAVGLATCVGG